MVKNDDVPHKKKASVLADHRQIGKRFVPPFIHHFGSYESGKLFDPGWYDRILPELLIHGLLNDMYGLRHGADLSLALAKSGVEALASRTRVLFIGASDYTKLTEAEQRSVRYSLDQSNQLEEIKHALYPLFRFYPEFPLSFLYSGGVAIFTNPEEIMNGFKELLAKLANRWGTEGTLMQANAVYIAFITEFLFVAAGLALAKFPAIKDFPDTDESRRIGSAVRGTISTFWGQPDRATDTTWSAYFWHRGKELEKCSYGR